MPMQQTTLLNDIEITDIGLHSGKPVHIVMRAAPADHGIQFKRSDMEEGTNIVSPGYDRVVDTRLCTLIANDQGAKIGTIEHLMAAIRACDLDNVLIEIDAAEVPIMDGSSIQFVEAIEKAGMTTLDVPRRAIKILKEVRVVEGDKDVSLSPSDASIYAGKIDFPHPSVGVQEYEFELSHENFKNDVANCRTFGFLKDVEMMRAAGLALGGSLDNAVVVDDNGVMNPDGLRRPDEFVRHKLLDAVGDLHCAGLPIIGRYYGIKGGHDMNNKLLRALFAQPDSFEIAMFSE
jgi:UDP-3-O-[3-hydroxymyristoyl] N-acetylglucosamine deacetylase